jgi:hypothetical protein
VSASPRCSGRAGLLVRTARHRASSPGLFARPPGWRADDFIGRGDGFLPLAGAAQTLGLSEAETLEMCRHGLLEAEERGGSLYVRPAIVSVLGVAG